MHTVLIIYVEAIKLFESNYYDVEIRKMQYAVVNGNIFSCVMYRHSIIVERSKNKSFEKLGEI